ncbi:MAG: SPOR domain-containing protein [Rhodomicrobium sp.]
MSLRSRVAPKLLPIAAFALAAALVLPGAADARRRWHRQSYSPPASAMAVDLNTGRILYSKNANEPRYPASLTKVMTVYLLFDALRDGKISMKTELRVSAHAAAQSPTKLDLSEGDRISVADAIGAIVTKSANDMAVAVAEALAGSEEEFARRMTQKARTIGMLNTTFRNASGLPNPEQKTTAQDLIILGQSILADHPERCKVFGMRYFQYDREVYRNHNTLLFTYEGMEGMKTGFTSASGFNLLASAHRGDKRLLAVVLGGRSAGSRNVAMVNILDHAWPKALTQVAARKAGILEASAKQKPVQAEVRETPARREAKETKHEIAASKPVLAAPSMRELATVLRLRKGPDRTSRSILLASIEAGLVTKSRAQASAESEMTTDEPEDKAAQAVSKSPTYVLPPAQEIASNESLAKLATAPQAKNVSVHYKTVHPSEVPSLAPAALDVVPEREAEASSGEAGMRRAAPAPEEPRKAQVASNPIPPESHMLSATNPSSSREPETLASATAAASHDMDQPGPYHVQVGAFTDQAQAKERLESVRETLGTALIKAHPQFIMPVAMPGGATMFRARLSRFADEAQARAACRKLKRNGIECWDVPVQ